MCKLQAGYNRRGIAANAILRRHAIDAVMYAEGNNT